MSICYPKRTDRPIFAALVTQCSSLGIPFLDPAEVLRQSPLRSRYDIALDALFGFSFAGPPVRPPFAALLGLMEPGAGPPPAVVSVDVPSGWDVDAGPPSEHSGGGGGGGTGGLAPDLLVSLTAPKPCSVAFKGDHHYLGLRGLPPGARERYPALGRLPAFPGAAQCVKLPRLS